jgi:O-antigen/teichoic acid export membrane protein
MAMNRFSLLKRAGTYGTGAATLAVLKLVLVPVYTRLLSPAEYGLYTAVYSMIGLLSFMCLLGMDEATSREFYDHHPQAGEFRIFVGNVLGFVSLAAMVLGLAGWSAALGGLAGARTGYLVRNYGPLLLAIGLLTSWMGIFNVLLVARQKAMTYVLSQNLRSLVMIGVAILLLLKTRLGIMAILWAEGVSLLFLVGFLALEFHRQYPGGPGLGRFVPRAKALATLKYALPFVLYSGTNWILSASDRLVLARFCSLEDLGRYGLGYTLAGGMNTVVLGGLNMAYAPVFLRRAKEREDHAACYARDLEVYALAVGYVTLALMLLCPEAIRIIAPAKYQGAESVMRIVLFAFLLLGLYLMYSLPLVLHRKSLVLAGASLLAAVTNLGLNFLLVPRFGALTAAWTTALGYLVMAVVTMVKSGAIYPAKVRTAAVWGVVAGVLAMGMGFGTSSLLLRLLILAGTGGVTALRAWKALEHRDGPDLRPS